MSDIWKRNVKDRDSPRKYVFDLLYESDTYGITKIYKNAVNFINTKLEPYLVGTEDEPIITGSVALSENFRELEALFPVNLKSVYNIISCLPDKIMEYEIEIHPYQIQIQPNIIVAHMRFRFDTYKLKEVLECIDKYEK